jgi:hypothetical protein
MVMPSVIVGLHSLELGSKLTKLATIKFVAWNAPNVNKFWLYHSFMIEQRNLMTEAEIERIAERRMNMLDRNLLVGNISQEQYDQLVQDLEDWSKEEYAKLRRMS